LRKVKKLPSLKKQQLEADRRIAAEVWRKYPKREDRRKRVEFFCQIAGVKPPNPDSKEFHALEQRLHRLGAEAHALSVEPLPVAHRGEDGEPHSVESDVDRASASGRQHQTHPKAIPASIETADPAPVLAPHDSMMKEKAMRSKTPAPPTGPLYEAGQTVYTLLSTSPNQPPEVKQWQVVQVRVRKDEQGRPEYGYRCQDRQGALQHWHESCLNTEADVKWRWEESVKDLIETHESELAYLRERLAEGLKPR
jgi:hypothetical protein